MLQLEALNRSRDENADILSKVFELSQSLSERWFTADYAEKRKILWLNCRLVDGSLCPEIRKPFDVVAEGLLAKESGGGRTPVEFFLNAVKDWDIGTTALLGSVTSTEVVTSRSVMEVR